MLDKFTIAAKIFEEFNKTNSNKTRIDHLTEIEKIWNGHGTDKEKSAAAAEYIKKAVDQIQIPEDLKDLKIDLVKYLLGYPKLIEHLHSRDTTTNT